MWYKVVVDSQSCLQYLGFVKIMPTGTDSLIEGFWISCCSFEERCARCDGQGGYRSAHDTTGALAPPPPPEAAAKAPGDGKKAGKVVFGGGNRLLAAKVRHESTGLLLCFTLPCAFSGRHRNSWRLQLEQLNLLSRQFVFLLSSIGDECGPAKTLTFKALNAFHRRRRRPRQSQKRKRRRTRPQNSQLSEESPTSCDDSDFELA